LNRNHANNVNQQQDVSIEQQQQQQQQLSTLQPPPQIETSSTVLPILTRPKPWLRRKRINKKKGQRRMRIRSPVADESWIMTTTNMIPPTGLTKNDNMMMDIGIHNNTDSYLQPQYQSFPDTSTTIPLPTIPSSSSSSSSSSNNNKSLTNDNIDYSTLGETNFDNTYQDEFDELSSSSSSSSKVKQLRTKYQGWKTRRREQYDGWKVRRREQYQGWKSRRRDQYQGWKSRRQQQYQGWKSRRQQQYDGWKIRRREQYDGWKLRRHEKWTDRKNRALEYLNRKVLLREYSLPEWFDVLGRPITSKDSTGRFVNPWQSQSTNGVHSVGTLWRWRWQRLERELRQIGFVGILMNILPWTTNPISNSPLIGQVVPPLPQPVDDKLQFTWIGHATGLIHVEKDFTILVDPMFSVRASPYQNSPIGVARDVPPAFTVQELVNQQRINQQQHQASRSMNGVINSNDYIGKFDICCITHDHYDHMDRDSIIELKDHIQLWIAPLGIKEWLVDKCNIDATSIVELEWWEQIRITKSDNNKVIVVQLPEQQQNDDASSTLSSHESHFGSSTGSTNNHLTNPHFEVITITCCPASHWGGRTMLDRNFRLWCSFAFATSKTNFFYSGDTGYPEGFPLFHQIGDVLGPFDFATIPIAAYEPEELNKDAHINPREAVQVHKDLRSKQSVAIHWGTFQLTEEPMDAPPRDLQHAIQQEEGHSSTPINFSILNHGETFEIDMMTTSMMDSTTSSVVGSNMNYQNGKKNDSNSNEEGDEEERESMIQHASL
jgi:N-acyl-phosphatidylethanolamine-hydrolysing phospholipase D